MTTALLDRLTHLCDIIETGNDSWRLKNPQLKPTLVNRPAPDTSIGPKLTPATNESCLDCASIMGEDRAD